MRRCSDFTRVEEFMDFAMGDRVFAAERIMKKRVRRVGIVSDNLQIMPPLGWLLGFKTNYVGPTPEHYITFV